MFLGRQPVELILSINDFVLISKRVLSLAATDFHFLHCLLRSLSQKNETKKVANMRLLHKPPITQTVIEWFIEWYIRGPFRASLRVLI